MEPNSGSSWRESVTTFRLIGRTACCDNSACRCAARRPLYDKPMASTAITDVKNSSTKGAVRADADRFRARAWRPGLRQGRALRPWTGTFQIAPSQTLVAAPTLGESPGTAGSANGPGQLVELGLNFAERTLRQTNVPRHISKVDRLRIKRQRFAIGICSSRQIVGLLRQSGKLPRAADKAVATRAISIGELSRFAIGWCVSVTLRLVEGVGAAVEILEAVDERASQSKERIGPAGTELCGLAECRNGVRQMALRQDSFVPPHSCLAVNPVQVAFAISQRGPKPSIGSADCDRARQRVARHLPLLLSYGRERRTKVCDDPVGKRGRSLSQRAFE